MHMVYTKNLSYKLINKMPLNVRAFLLFYLDRIKEEYFILGQPVYMYLLNFPQGQTLINWGIICSKAM